MKESPADKNISAKLVQLFLMYLVLLSKINGFQGASGLNKKRFSCCYCLGVVGWCRQKEQQQLVFMLAAVSLRHFILDFNMILGSFCLSDHVCSSGESAVIWISWINPTLTFIFSSVCELLLQQSSALDAHTRVLNAQLFFILTVRLF